MKIRYYETAWHDISNSKNWFGKLCLLALLNFIPIFGQIVMFGYLYGWAREIAWGLHAPMPEKIFNNEDGKFWRRGWFVFVLAFVFSLIPNIVMNVGSYMEGMSYGVSGVSGNAAMGVLGTLLYYIGLAGAVLLAIFSWIGSMRVSIYDRLSAGFQFDKIWKMFRHDTGGIMRIVGMYLLVGLIVSIILSIIIMILIFMMVFAGVAGAMSMGYSVDALENMSDRQAVMFLIQIIASSGVVGVICLVAGAFVSSLSITYLYTLVVRAVGYWVRQFDVPRWRGQDEPLPFEMAGAGQGPGMM